MSGWVDYVRRATGQPGWPTQIRYAVLATIFFLIPMPAWAAAGGDGEGLGLVPAVGLAIVAAAFLAVVFNRFKQPALLAYIVCGLLLNLFAGGLFAGSLHTIESISHLGLVFLLFIIGLEMDISGILRLGPKAATAILLQAPIAIGAILGLQWAAAQAGIALPGLGSTPGSWLFYGVAVALGSTAVVIKLLGENFDLTSQAGKVTVLTLIGEDIWAVLALTYVSSQGGGADSPSVLVMLGGAAVLVTAFVLFARFVLARVLAFLARSPDMIVLVSLGWCFLCAEGMALVGLSAEMGALVAGLTIGRLPQATEILARVISLRDFFMALFFVALGMLLPIPTAAVLGYAAVLVVIIILARLLLYAPTLMAAGQGPIVSLATSINLAQVSEFSLLIVPIGVANGALTGDDAAVISYGLMLSVVLSSYAIKQNYKISMALAKLLRRGEAEEAPAPVAAGGDGHHGADVIFLGYYLNAEAVVHRLKQDAPNVLEKILVIDYNLQNHPKIQAQGVRVAYGDISNPETLHHHGIAGAKVIVSTIEDAFLQGTSNTKLLQELRHLNPDARIISTAASAERSRVAENMGAFRSVAPPEEAAPAFAAAIREALVGTPAMA